MKTTFISLFFFFSVAQATTIIVDINGGGNFTSISAAITAAVPGDTIKVWPGVYNQQVVLNKNVVLMGSGYENTSIIGNFNPTITMSAGKLMWFMISSSAGNGINLSGGLVTNCVIYGCVGNGINNPTSGSNASVTNCIILFNTYAGISSKSSGTLNVTNCISRNNGGYGFDGYYNGMSLSFSNGSRYYTNGNQGCIDQDPLFASASDFRISEGSPCWNMGNLGLLDPDGSRSDMGYFGGPNCPIYPTVFEILIEPAGNNINLKAKARANY